MSCPGATGAHVLLGNRGSEWACWKGGQAVGKAGGHHSVADRDKTQQNWLKQTRKTGLQWGGPGTQTRPSVLFLSISWPHLPLYVGHFLSH